MASKIERIKGHIEAHEIRMNEARELCDNEGITWEECLRRMNESEKMHIASD